VSVRSGRPGTQVVRLDRERILDAVERIVTTEGLATLTMRRIGTELGVDPTAVYRHFRNKEALLDALAERAFLTTPELDPAQPWQQRVRAVVRHALARYRAHPDLGVRLAQRDEDIAGVIHIRELVLALLDEAGLDVEQAAMMSHVLENHVVGCGVFFAISDQGRDSTIDEAAALRRAYAMASEREAPHVVAAAPYLFPEADQVFEYATGLLIEAIERQAERNRGREPQA
jgi:AcrR family transcriptional regulator